MSEDRKTIIIARARELAALRVPFVHQGNTLDGIDCIRTVAKAMDYREEIPTYPRDPVNGELETELENRFGPPLMEISRAHPKTTIEGLEACDLLSMQYRGPIRHLAIVIPHIAIAGALSIVHADSAAGHVVEHILDVKWLRRIVKVWRIV